MDESRIDNLENQIKQLAQVVAAQDQRITKIESAPTQVPAPAREPITSHGAIER
jgi:hypothetical protein